MMTSLTVLVPQNGFPHWLITVVILLIGWVYKEFLQSHLDLMYQYEANVN